MLRNLKRSEGGWLCALAPGLILGVTNARAQDALTLPGKNYTVTFENSDVAVIRAHYGPHEKIPVHDHKDVATVFVYLSDSGPVKISHEGDGSKELAVTRPPVLKGAYRIAPGMAEKHSIENLGDLRSDFLRVELKRVSLTLKEPFRGKGPLSLDADSNAVEFREPGLALERIVCVGAPACLVKPMDAPSLLIAFTEFSMTLDATQRKEMVEAGTVRWVPALQGASVMASGMGSAAHLLRIIVPDSKK